MIHTEKKIYEFLKKIMKEKGFNVYRGFLPSNSFEDRENGKKTNDYFPFVILRALEFRQELVLTIIMLFLILKFGLEQKKIRKKIILKIWK